MYFAFKKNEKYFALYQQVVLTLYFGNVYIFRYGRFHNGYKTVREFVQFVPIATIGKI